MMNTRSKTQSKKKETSSVGTDVTTISQSPVYNIHLYLHSPSDSTSTKLVEPVFHLHVGGKEPIIRTPQRVRKKKTPSKRNNTSRNISKNLKNKSNEDETCLNDTESILSGFNPLYTSSQRKLNSPDLERENLIRDTSKNKDNSEETVGDGENDSTGDINGDQEEDIDTNCSFVSEKYQINENDNDVRVESNCKKSDSFGGQDKTPNKLDKFTSSAYKSFNLKKAVVLVTDIFAQRNISPRPRGRSTDPSSSSIEEERRSHSSALENQRTSSTSKVKLNCSGISEKSELSRRPRRELRSESDENSELSAVNEVSLNNDSPCKLTIAQTCSVSGERSRNFSECGNDVEIEGSEECGSQLDNSSLSEDEGSALLLNASRKHGETYPLVYDSEQEPTQRVVVDEAVRPILNKLNFSKIKRQLTVDTIDGKVLVRNKSTRDQNGRTEVGETETELNIAREEEVVEEIKSNKFSSPSFKNRNGQRSQEEDRSSSEVEELAFEKTELKQTRNTAKVNSTEGKSKESLQNSVVTCDKEGKVSTDNEITVIEENLRSNGDFPCRLRNSSDAVERLRSPVQSNGNTRFQKSAKNVETEGLNGLKCVSPGSSRRRLDSSVTQEDSDSEIEEKSRKDTNVSEATNKYCRLGNGSEKKVQQNGTKSDRKRENANGSTLEMCEIAEVEREERSKRSSSHSSLTSNEGSEVVCLDVDEPRDDTEDEMTDDKPRRSIKSIERTKSMSTDDMSDSQNEDTCTKSTKNALNGQGEEKNPTDTDESVEIETQCWNAKTRKESKRRRKSSDSISESLLNCEKSQKEESPLWRSTKKPRGHRQRKVESMPETSDSEGETTTDSQQQNKRKFVVDLTEEVPEQTSRGSEVHRPKRQKNTNVEREDVSNGVNGGFCLFEGAEVSMDDSDDSYERPLVVVEDEEMSQQEEMEVAELATPEELCRETGNSSDDTAAIPDASASIGGCRQSDSVDAGSPETETGCLPQVRVHPFVQRNVADVVDEMKLKKSKPKSKKSSKTKSDVKNSKTRSKGKKTKNPGGPLSSGPKSNKKYFDEDEYIPLQVTGPTKFAVAKLDQIKAYKKHDATTFKERMLYGDRVRRFATKKVYDVYKMKNITASKPK